MKNHTLVVTCKAPNKLSAEQVRNIIADCICVGMLEARETLENCGKDEWFIDPRPALSIRKIGVEIAGE